MQIITRSRSILRVTIFLTLVTVGALGLLAVPPTNSQTWTIVMALYRQDIWLLAGQFMIFGLALAPLTFRLPATAPTLRTVCLVGLTLVLFCYAGHRFVLMGYDLLRDEQMATFDAAIFAQGRLVWPIPPEWRVDAAALSLTFMLPAEQPAAWVSAYLPGNAALRAAVAQLADPALTGPLITGASLPAMWACARKIWPDDSQAATICIVLLACSGQFLLAGMSAFAMPAHLLFNLVWLRLFLSNRRACDIVALAIGFVATGLHQPLFHPLFVAPFLIWILWERQWWRSAIFMGGYLAIGLFWLSWPGLMLRLVVEPGSNTDLAGVDYVSRLVETVLANSDNLTIMAANLLRFIAWQHALAVPLALLGLHTLWRNHLGMALLGGIVLTTVVMAIILPWQGGGFGYRYLHGLLGNLVLLAGFGWRSLDVLQDRRCSGFATASVASIALLLPIELWTTHVYYGVFARASADINRTGSDYAIIDGESGIAASSLVFNRPDLSNRPIRLVAKEIADPDRLAKRICKPGTSIAYGGDAYFRRIAAAFGVRHVDMAEKRLPALSAPYRRAGCRIVVLE